MSDELSDTRPGDDVRQSIHHHEQKRVEAAGGAVGEVARPGAVRLCGVALFPGYHSLDLPVRERT